MASFLKIAATVLFVLAGTPCATASLSAQQKSNDVGVKVPDGFKIERICDDSLATNIYSLTIDSHGRPVVAGPGYIRILLDQNRDGIMDDFIEFADSPKNGAMGLYFDGNDLICTGDEGLLRFVDANADGVADGPPTTMLKMKTGGEHCAHAVRRGPDGWLYVLAGNATDILPEYFDGPNSPVKDPKQGFLMRISPDESEREIVAHGFRNAYDFDFDSQGEIYVYDSDGERDVSLPWYRPTRVFRIQPGLHAGFISQSWKRPAYYPDMPEAVAKLGRGSPTGVECYRHHQFPKGYYDTLFVLDWTFGRIYSVIPSNDSDRKQNSHQIFAETVGHTGFAPTDCAVAVDGSLLVSVGGRGTQGGVYRIYYEGAKPDSKDERPAQPLASWSTQPESWAPVNTNWIKSAQVRDEFFKSASAASWSKDSDKPQNPKVPLLAIRAAQIHLENLPLTDTKHKPVFDGYVAGIDDAKRSVYLPNLPGMIRSKGVATATEAIRLAAMLGGHQPESEKAIVDRLESGISVPDTIHRLIALARLDGTSETTKNAIALALTTLQPRIRADNLAQDRHWEIRVGELIDELHRKDPRLSKRLLAIDEFGSPDHALLFRVFKGQERDAAIGRLVKNIELLIGKPNSSIDGRKPSIDNRVVRLVAAKKTSNTRALLRRLYHDYPELNLSIVKLLAEKPDQIDIEKFVDGIRSGEPGTMRVCADAIKKLNVRLAGKAMVATIQSLRRLGWDKHDQSVRQKIVELLREQTGKNYGFTFGQDGLVPQREVIDLWVKFAVDNFPSAAGALSQDRSKTLNALLRKISDSANQPGNAIRGAKLYRDLACAKCHEGNRTVGPNLAGVTKRFSHDDLLTSVIDPNRQVSSRYKTLKILTVDGKKIVGIVIYQSVDGVTLVDSQGVTVRVEQDSIDEMKTTPQSLMPEGMLDECNAQDWRDLFEYMKTK